MEDSAERLQTMSLVMRRSHGIGLLAIFVTAWISFGSGGAAAHEETVSLAGLDVTVWSPDSAPAGRLPVIFFSHGFHGCATQSRFLMEAFAQAGFLVFAPNHRDATCASGTGHWTERSATSFKDANLWTDATYADRGDDIRRLASAIGPDSRYGARADLARVGLVGHSLGGYTVLGLGGAWPAWRMPHVTAILALSPYVEPFLLHRTLGALDAATMLQGGSLDFGITPTLRRPQGAYDQLGMPKYFIEFEGASHFAWTDLGRTARASIVAYGVAFMERYVKGDSSADVRLRQKRPDVLSFQSSP
jgi:predicted dienelactone hydrolase